MDEQHEQRHQQYLTFTLADEAYGVDVLQVQEIRGWQPVREMPDTPSFVKGVINLRDTLVPIIDLRERFGLGHLDYTAMTVVIVLSINYEDIPYMVGIVVDAVSDVIDVTGDQIKKTPRMGSRINIHYMKGMVTDADRMVMLLDADRLLNPEDFNQFSELARDSHP